ncbi:MAG: GYD domain-containing protein [bacterium]
MAHYMIQLSYRPEQVKAMMENPQDRSEAARKVAEGLGGRLESFFFAFGDYDVVIIGEFPDNEAAMACAILVIGVGTASSFKTTVLMTSDQAVAAMKKAGTLVGSYQPPAG